MGFGRIKVNMLFFFFFKTSAIVNKYAKLHTGCITCVPSFPYIMQADLEQQLLSFLILADDFVVEK